MVGAPEALEFSLADPEERTIVSFDLFPGSEPMAAAMESAIARAHAVEAEPGAVRGPAGGGGSNDRSAGDRGDGTSSGRRWQTQPCQGERSRDAYSNGSYLSRSNGAAVASVEMAARPSQGRGARAPPASSCDRAGGRDADGEADTGGI